MIGRHCQPDLALLSPESRLKLVRDEIARHVDMQFGITVDWKSRIESALTPKGMQTLQRTLDSFFPFIPAKAVADSATFNDLATTIFIKIGG